MYTLRPLDVIHFWQYRKSFCRVSEWHSQCTRTRARVNALEHDSNMTRTRLALHSRASVNLWVDGAVIPAVMEANKKWCSQRIINDAATVREKGRGGGCSHIGVWDFTPEQSISLYRWVLVIVPPLNNIIHHLHMLI